MVNLMRLDLSNNNLTDDIPSQLPIVTPRLERIDLSNNRLSGPIPTGLQNWRYLQELRLSVNSITGTIDSLSLLNPHVGGLELHLDRNNLTGDLTGIGRSVQLKVLNLSENRLSGSLDPLSKLCEIQLDYNEQLQNLQVLALQGNFISAELMPLSNLFHVLNKNHSENPRFVLNLSRNQLSGSIPAGAIQSYILSLDLSHNHLSGPITLDESYGSAIVAETLNLSHNRLSGVLPEMNETALFLKTLMLNNNEFSGVLPAWILEMPTAVTLDVSVNLLQGSLVSLESMTRLVILNLSWNNLSGTIPDSVASLVRSNHLRSVDVSHNNFGGSLPNFPTEAGVTYSFVYNTRLCGPQYFQLHPCRKSSDEKLPIAVGVSVSALVLVLACSLFAVRRRRASIDNQLDADLVAAIEQGDITTRLVSYRELQKATANFSPSSQIGVGGFGTVYKGLLGHQVVAIKTSNKISRVNEAAEGKQQFLNEVQILSGVNHRKLVRLLGCSLTRKMALLVFEYASQGTLGEHLHGERGEKRLDWGCRLRIAVQTADALLYLHSAANPPIIHRDVKPANILLDDNLNAKVADFGISKLVASLDASHATTLNVQGTLGYIDPDYFTCLRLSTRSDVYSFGVVLLELISAQAPLDRSRGDRDSNLVEMAKHLTRTDALHLLVDPILKDSFDESEDIRDSIVGVANLALTCVNRSVEDRPNMKQVCSELETLSVGVIPRSRVLSLTPEVGEDENLLTVFLGASNSSEYTGSGKQISENPVRREFPFTNGSRSESHHSLEALSALHGR